MARTLALYCFAALQFLPAATLDAQALAAPITGLIGNASYMNVFLTGSTVRQPPFGPERGSVARGVGFELAFGLPGGRKSSRRSASIRQEGPKCEARFSRGELTVGAKCADTTVIAVTRTSGSSPVTFEETLKVEPFEWELPAVVFDLGVSFTQTGALVSEGDLDARVSLRELPALTFYTSFVDVPVLRDIPGHPSIYVGARTGFLTLYNGRAYSDTTFKFSSETLQIGPVVGSMATIAGLSIFAEAAYLWRDFKNVDWEPAVKLRPTFPRRIDMSGVTYLFGIQFDFAKE